MEKLEIKTEYKNQLIDITIKIQKILNENQWENGMIFLNVLHTTAGITINENADPDVKTDLINALEKIVPSINFLHFEGNSDAHLKAMLVGVNLSIPVVNGKLVVGTWQGIYFCEFDGPRNRQVVINFCNIKA